MRGLHEHRLRLVGRSVTDARVQPDAALVGFRVRGHRGSGLGVCRQALMLKLLAFQYR